MQNNRTHYLKVDQKYFERIVSGQKTFEIRYNDRDYQVGDYIFFEDIQGLNRLNRYYVIIYILNYPEALKDGWIVMGIKELKGGENEAN